MLETLGVIIVVLALIKLIKNASIGSAVVNKEYNHLKRDVVSDKDLRRQAEKNVIDSINKED